MGAAVAETVSAMEVTREGVADAAHRSQAADVLLFSAAASDHAAPTRVGHREPLRLLFLAPLLSDGMR